MKTIEEAAREHENRDSISIEDGEYTSRTVTEAFKAGADFAQEWIDVKEELPNDDERYLCKDTYDGEIKLLCYNPHYKCWDDSSGDDYYCNTERISHWRPIERK